MTHLSKRGDVLGCPSAFVYYAIKRELINKSMSIMVPVLALLFIMNREARAKDIVVYYESRKRELKIRLMNEGRCDERLKARVEESTCLTYTGLHDKTN